MSPLSDLVHLRTIEVSPLQCTTLEFRQRVKPRYIYSGPLLRNSPVSALDDHGSSEGAFSPGAPRGRILQEESACERAIPASAPLVVRSPL
ncbi:BQ5605_C015g07782 [Microbotryum silenes-dioicae]|uniref:BQ5605_C015g07755 protein n=1 Tax=Microbotryum silenes-dioicae TaxID=796604 RepID=A0A2X0MEE8_9BASI|nr:BQ5605_C015g07755 [Microbotryum silenes-dioicae]SGY17427.1 BQ5605_C015g07782 [Microbotryum silenes-dioicae]